MKISCDCGSFTAELTHVPGHTPGRLVCYCRDCQSYLERLGRGDLLDPYGGTEVIPAYPSEVRFTSGTNQLVCNRLTADGLYRWSTRCCHSPIANTRPGFPWAGFLHNTLRAGDTDNLDRLGPVRSRIHGRDAKGQPPFRISDKIDLRDMLTVFPFLLKGKLGGKGKNSPFFKADGVTPIFAPHLI